MVDVRLAKDAVDRQDWLTAYQRLSSAGEGTLRPADFVDLATTAYLLCRHDDCITAMQRAHQAYVAAGDVEASVRTAFWLALILRTSGEGAVANGWVNRAERLAADLPADSVERGYVEYARLLRAVFSKGIERSDADPGVIVECGRRCGDPNLVAAGLMSGGRWAIQSGRTAEGLAMLDEAIVCLLSGGLSPIIAGQVLCSAIEACQELWEVRRVAEWTRALDSWCDSQEGLEMYAGTCALHKGQVLAAQGSFTAAVAEFEDAIERITRAGASTRSVAIAFTEMGDALRSRGSLPEAEQALRRAASLGRDPSSSLILLDLATGKRESAVAAARRLLDEPRDPIHRTQRLALLIGVLLDSGDVAGAASAVQELSRLAEAIGTPVFKAHAARARGALALAQGSPSVAVTELRSAFTTFCSAGSRYEAARTQLTLADALDAAREPGAASRERDAATASLETMRAVPRAPSPLTDRQIEVLRLVALGRSNRDIARSLNLSEKTVARHLSNIFVALGVNSRTAAAAYGFEHDLVG